MSTRRQASAPGRASVPVVFLALVVVSLVDARQVVAQPTATFDWSMPDRYGLDQDRDGIIDAHDAQDAIHQDTWRVDLDASASEGSIESYSWSINGEFAARSARSRVAVEFPGEGSYEVTLVVEDARGATARSTRTVTVQDWLIVAVGDSYGSGEGAPDIPISARLFDDSVAAWSDLQGAQADLADAQRIFGDRVLEVGAASAVVAARLRELTSASRILESAQGTLTDAQGELDGIQADVGPALEALDDWQEACPFSLDCFAATQALTSALVQLGIAGISDLISDGFSAIRTAINGADDLAAAALEKAQGAYDVAFAAWQAADAAYDAAVAALGIAEAARDLAGEAVGVAEAAVTDFTELWEEISEGLVGTWQDLPCHRSALSGQAQAALLLERSDPRTSVTFVHLACSGATIRRGLLGIYGGVEPEPLTTNLPQIEEAAGLVGGREVDALLVSIGGNDVGFVPIVKACAQQSRCHIDDEPDFPARAVAEVCGVEALGGLSTACLEAFASFEADSAAVDIFEGGVERLPDSYDDLAEEISELLPEMEERRVYLAAYPAATQDDRGDLCGRSINPGDNFPGISFDEWTFVDANLGPVLNVTLGESAARNGWSFIDGIESSFDRHGYCAFEHWIVRLQESFATQGNYFGAVHPNADGYAQYGRVAARRLEEDLYPRGTARAPRMRVIGGRIRTTSERPLAGVRLSYTNFGGRDTTDADGAYGLGVPDGWSGRVTPSLEGYVFEPRSRTYDSIDEAMRAEDFVATRTGETGGVGPFLRGDANGDLGLDISDALFLLGVLFLGNGDPSCRAALDPNGDGAIDISDAAALLNYLFLGGRSPVAPHPACGRSRLASDERLGCEEPSACP